MRATRGSAANAARRVGSSPSFAHERQREQRRVVLGRAALVRHGDDARDDARAVGGDAADDRLGVLARQLALRRVVRPALASRGSGSGRGAPSRRPPRRSRRCRCAPATVPGIGCDCGVFLKLNHLLRYVMAKLLFVVSFLRCWFRPAPLRANGVERRRTSAGLVAVPFGTGAHQGSWLGGGNPTLSVRRSGGGGGIRTRYR